MELGNLTGLHVLQISGSRLDGEVPPEFEQATYTFTVSEDASVGDDVGTVETDDDNAGDTLTCSITVGYGDGKFTINGSTGDIMVAGPGLRDRRRIHPHGTGGRRDLSYGHGHGDRRREQRGEGAALCAHGGRRYAERRHLHRHLDRGAAHQRCSLCYYNQ